MSVFVEKLLTGFVEFGILRDRKDGVDLWILEIR